MFGHAHVTTPTCRKYRTFAPVPHRSNFLATPLLMHDCFVIFRSPNHVRPFQVYLKSQHPNISFTSELETNSKLLFLDILIDRSDNGFSTSVYRKPSFTALFTKFDSFYSHIFYTLSYLYSSGLLF